jgi:hypothetical protein
MTKKVQKEEAPTVNVSAGKVAGLGIGPQGEPGVPKKKRKVIPFKTFVRKPPQ